MTGNNLPPALNLRCYILLIPGNPVEFFLFGSLGSPFSSYGVRKSPLNFIPILVRLFLAPGGGRLGPGAGRGLPGLSLERLVYFSHRIRRKLKIEGRTNLSLWALGVGDPQPPSIPEITSFFFNAKSENILQ